MAERKPTVWDWLGFSFRPDFAKARALGRLIGVAMFLAAVVILIGPLARLFQAIWAGDDEAVRNLGFLLAALIGAPFVIWRSVVAQKQANIAEENLTTDLINKAVEGLGAQKEVNRIGRTMYYRLDGRIHRVFEWIDAPYGMPEGSSRDDEETTEWKPFAETRPNIEVRTGAILALERLSQKTPSEHVRIMEILCAYLRENFRCESPDPAIETPEAYADGKSWHDFRDALRKENHRLRIKPRTDLATALEVLKRRNADREGHHDAEGKWHGYRLDLRGIDLRRFDLSGIALLRANLTEAQMQGANLTEAQMQRANLSRAEIQGAVLKGTKMQKAVLRSAQMRGAMLYNSEMQDVDLSWAEMGGADLDRAQMQGANLRAAQMQGTKFGLAEMQGAGLDGTKFSDATRFDPASLRGAGLTRVDLTKIKHAYNLPALLAEAYGDARVILPEGLAAGQPPLAHWSDKELDYAQFDSQWRAFQKSIGYSPTPFP